MAAKPAPGDRIKIVLSDAPREAAEHLGRYGKLVHYTRTAWARVRLDDAEETILVHPGNLRRVG